MTGDDMEDEDDKKEREAKEAAAAQAAANLEILVAELNALENVYKTKEPLTYIEELQALEAHYGGGNKESSKGNYSY